MPHPIALQNDDVRAAAGQLNGTGHTDHSAADDCDVVFHRLRCCKVVKSERPNGGEAAQEILDFIRWYAPGPRRL